MTVNPPIWAYVKKIVKKIFKVKVGYYLKLLTAKTMRLLESTENKTTKNENGENVSHLEITWSCISSF